LAFFVRSTAFRRASRSRLKAVLRTKNAKPPAAKQTSGRFGQGGRGQVLRPPFLRARKVRRPRGLDRFAQPAYKEGTPWLRPLRRWRSPLPIPGADHVPLETSAQGRESDGATGAS